MGIIELLAAMGLTGLTSIKLAGLLADKLISNRLAKDLKEFEAQVNRQLADHTANLTTTVNAAKAEVEARHRQEVELTLGDAAADRAYRSEAKKRLYQALGPLRFQLLVAAAEWTNRVARIGDKDASTYDTSSQGHFLRSTAYRFLRLLAIAELIERQIAFADFAVDPDMRTLLRFKRQLGQCFSSSDVSLGHPDEDWLCQRQHVFNDVLSNLAAAMVVKDGATETERVARFDEFQAMWDDPERAKGLQPLPTLMTGFTPSARPILWLRMLALSQLCTGLLETQGQALDLEVQPINLEAMLVLSNDKPISDEMSKYLGAVSKFKSALVIRPIRPTEK